MHHGRIEFRVGESFSPRALAAPPPRDGEVRHTALPDSFDGIRFEIGRMIRYVQDAAKDEIIRRNAEAACSEHFGRMASMGRSDEADADPGRSCIEAIDAWCREHFFYLNDPPNIEVIQTPRRMVKQTQVPSEVIRGIIAPFYESMASAIGPEAHAYEPPSLCVGDCDEGGVLFLGHCACVPVTHPLRFRFGGNDGTLHHVWSRAHGGTDWVDSDLTEPDYGIGEFSEFDAYEEVEVPV
jgi:hypothetical protein